MLNRLLPYATVSLRLKTSSCLLRQNKKDKKQIKEQLGILVYEGNCTSWQYINEARNRKNRKYLVNKTNIDIQMGSKLLRLKLYQLL